MAGKNSIILVVEDEAILRMQLCDDLEDQGYRVADFPTGDEACSYLLTGGTCNLLLTDVRMPGKCDGLQLAKWVEGHHPNVPIILMSSHLTGSQIGDREFVAKPYETANLIKKVADMLAA